MRLPWQNQSSQNSHVLLASTAAPSASAGLNSTFGSASVQLNTGYSAGPGSKFDAVSRPLDEAVEPNPALHPRFLFIRFYILLVLWFMYLEVLIA